MAIQDADVLAVNVAAEAYHAAVRKVLGTMTAGQELKYVPLRDHEYTNAVPDAIGTASTDGGTLGDFVTAYPIDKAANLVIQLDDVSIDVIPSTQAFAGAAQQVQVVEGLDAEQSGWLLFGISGSAANLTAEVITGEYKTGGAEVPSLSGTNRHETEDETVGFVTSPRNNVEARNRFKAIAGGGFWSTPDGV